MAVDAAPRPDRSAAVKDKIRAAARHRFAQDGFDATGIRQIGAEAGVNPALVIRHFGSKERLFVETIDANATWANLLGGPLDDLGCRAVRIVLAERTNGLRNFGGIVRASGRADIHESLQHSIATRLAGPLVEVFEGPDARLRAHLFAAQLVGLMVALTVYDDSYLLTAPDEAIIQHYGQSLQRTVTG